MQVAMLQKATVKKVHAGFSKWSIIYCTGIPQQDNSVDCGVFVMKYMEHIAKPGDISWTSCTDWHTKMPMYRAQICAEIFKYFVYD